MPTEPVAARKLRPPVKRHGGKAYLARRIVDLMPPHETYIEPFLGGGSVLLNKPKAEREIAGDLDAGLINLWQQIRINHGFRCAVGHPYTLDTFEDARRWLDNPHPLSQAVGYMIRNRFSRGGLGKTFAWSDRLRGGQPGDANAWDTIRAELPAIAERVKDVEFFAREWWEVVPTVRQAAETLVYLDPPYLHETRTAKAAYEHEMTTDQHLDLLEWVNTTKARVMLSGYRSPLYDEALKGWRREEWDLPNHSGQGKTKQRRIECLWMNW